MEWDDARFDRFADAAVAMATGRLAGYGKPHVIMPYDPPLERVCLERVRRLPDRLRASGLSAHVIPVARIVAEALVRRRHATRALHDACDYDDFEASLASRDGAGLVDLLVPELSLELQRQAPECVAILCRVGVLYPFAAVSALLDGLYKAGIRNTLAIVYPGSAVGLSLKLLGAAEPTGGYHGHIVE